MDSGFNMLGQFQGDTSLGMEPSHQGQLVEFRHVGLRIGAERALEVGGQTADRYSSSQSVQLQRRDVQFYPKWDWLKDYNKIKDGIVSDRYVKRFMQYEKFMETRHDFNIYDREQVTKSF